MPLSPAPLPLMALDFLLEPNLSSLDRVVQGYWGLPVLHRNRTVQFSVYSKTSASRIKSLPLFLSQNPCYMYVAMLTFGTGWVSTSKV